MKERQEASKNLAARLWTLFWSSTEWCHHHPAFSLIMNSCHRFWRVIERGGLWMAYNVIVSLCWGWAAFHRLMPALCRPCDVSWSSSRCAFQKSVLLSLPVTSPSSKTPQLHHLVGLLGYQSEQSHQPPPSTGQTLLNQKFFLVKSEQKLLSVKT